MQLVDQTAYITTATSIHLCTPEKGIQFIKLERYTTLLKFAEVSVERCQLS